MIAPLNTRKSRKSLKPSHRITQANAEQALLDLLEASKNITDWKTIVLYVAEKIATDDRVGAVDLHQVLYDTSWRLDKLAEMFCEVSHELDEARDDLRDVRRDRTQTLSLPTVGVGPKDGVLRTHRPSSCDALPPLVVDQIERYLNREEARSWYEERARRGIGSSIKDAREFAECRLRDEYDKQV